MFGFIVWTFLWFHGVKTNFFFWWADGVLLYAELINPCGLCVSRCNVNQDVSLSEKYKLLCGAFLVIAKSLQLIQS